MGRDHFDNDLRTPSAGRSLAIVCAISLVLLVTLAAPLQIQAVQAASSAARVLPQPHESTKSYSSGGVLYVGASSTSSSALSNQGVKGTINVVNQQVAGLLSFWVSDDLSNNMWGQVGYYIYGGDAPLAFYQIWNLNTYSVVSGGTASVTAGAHSFSMYLQSGTTWAYALDGHVFGTYNMGSSVSSSTYPVYALSEEGSSTSFPFSSVEFSTAMLVLKSGTWSPVTSAKSYGNAWGVEGAMQTGTLGSNQIIVGSMLSSIPVGSTLWSGSPLPDKTPPTASITSPSSGATLSGVVTVSVSASDNVCVTKVELYVDGLLHATTTTSPYNFALDTTKLSNGGHTLVAKAYDAAGNVGTSNTVTITVASATTKVVSVVVTGPTSTVAGTLTQYTASVTVQSGSSGAGQPVSWYVDGVLYCSSTTSASLITQVGLSVVAIHFTAGTHTVYAVSGGVRSNSLTVVAS